MKKLKILLAAANQDTIEHLTRGLENFGYEVVSCTRGETAVRLAQDHRFELAIVSIDLIGLNGFEICRSLRRVLNDGEFPIIIHASRDSRQWRLTAFGSGANSFAFEPILFDRLDSVIKNLLKFKMCVEGSIPISDALHLLDAAYSDPGDPREPRGWPHQCDYTAIIRYCERLVSTYCTFESWRLDETRVMLRLIMHMSEYLGSAEAAIAHLCTITRDTRIAPITAGLHRRAQAKRPLPYEDEGLVESTEVVMVLADLASRIFCKGETAQQALKCLKNSDRGYDQALLNDLSDIVAKDEFLNSIFRGEPPVPGDTPA